jgi:hypothetical protein
VCPITEINESNETKANITANLDIEKKCFASLPLFQTRIFALLPLFRNCRLDSWKRNYGIRKCNSCKYGYWKFLPLVLCGLPVVPLARLPLPTNQVRIKRIFLEITPHLQIIS